MELAKQNILPHVINILLGKFIAALGSLDDILYAGQCTEILDVMQQDFSFTIVALVVRLGGVCAAMELKVQLAIPGDEFGTLLGLLFQASEKVIDRIAHLDTRKEADLVTHAAAASQLLDVLPRRTTTSISLAEDEQGRGVLIHGLVLGYTALDITKVSLSGIGLSRSHVAENLAAVEGDPVERGVWEIVDVVPAKLLCEESAHAGEAA